MEKFEMISITDIQKNPYQPRKEFDREKLDELAQSIKENGLIQPIIVRQSPVIGYEILAGERRYRASLLAGLRSIPAVVKQLSDQEMMVQSIIENLQRENLNPIEEARAYESLVEKGFTHAEIADKMGKSRPYISNSIRLLSLPEQILSEVENGKLSQAHARSLVGLNKEQQDYFFQRIIEEDISVRKLEALLTEKKQKKLQKNDHFIQNEEEQLKKLLGLDVEIKLSKKDSGKIIISFSNQEEYSRIINSLK
ncbi:ParB/RepB/Spo0J family partition protein [Streptococcus pseudopneumoniae]|uniref:Chromosome partitioning protein ParB n=1 Tax=Streptococcus pseudopneumoniae TaxID=257758 RepID=A0A3A4SGD9_9STRE|nr:ParB/RepB/Spo0J family partition protein [Streptococcus pseudopneumoniae]MBF9650444.1 ParB/RepB/Spo0J family partition protein [Streptococcus pseudopneumoniae]MBF9683820.1 ParB/RepB/Spo0J family partition protein [Streptococcus pseudopneumoniae]RJP12640.1 chromosome partitioning protein ParB [Streptococcus pseudopneumoniae]RJP84461.1 chromosome partitioning protein ParB [Streptococcus pseudopneumoniae]TMR62157.1 ParB/RepB/Spo0J family partition protein [Streptococcus pseudopneumoniae]